MNEQHSAVYTPRHGYLFAALLLFPSRAVLAGFLLAGPPPCPFIFLALKLLRSPELTASPDLACLFLPPKPYFSFFLTRLGFGPP